MLVFVSVLKVSGLWRRTTKFAQNNQPRGNWPGASITIRKTTAKFALCVSKVQRQKEEKEVERQQEIKYLLQKINRRMLL